MMIWTRELFPDLFPSYPLSRLKERETLSLEAECNYKSKNNNNKPRGEM
jgi:hypothetical protein